MWEQKLSQVYHLLIPANNQIIKSAPSNDDLKEELAYENSSNIYKGVIDQQKENKTIGSQVDELLGFAEEHGYVVPEEYVFKDEGYSGAILVRPGLERVRDLSAEGQIQVVLIYSPDRLSRNYAYQVVLMDEFASCGVEVIFINSPKADTPEEALLLQFQGMISEYERAMIKERSRRGKRFKAKSGVVNVLCGARYGYNYIKKTEDTAAYYEINEAEALVVQSVFKWYAEDFLSIGAITRELNEQKVSTRKRISKWQRSTVWGILFAIQPTEVKLVMVRQSIRNGRELQRH